MIDTLIVDDELWVCQLIRGIVNWPKLGFTIVGEANDGKKALAMIKKHHPDLVLTDIRMPGLDGLALIRKAKALHPDTVFIIVSGYGDFEYAKVALEHGASGYLLKPVDKKELTDLLARVQKAILERRDSASDRLLVKEKLEQSIVALRERFLYDLLFSRSKPAPRHDMQTVNKDYALGFQKGCFQVLIFKFDSIDPFSAKESDTASLDELIRQLIQGELAGLCYEVQSLRCPTQSITILNYHTLRTGQVTSAISTIFNQATQNSLFRNHFELTIGSGSCEEDLDLLPASHENAKKAIQSRVALGSNQIITLTNHRYSVIEMRDLFPVALETRLANTFEMFNTKASMELIRDLFTSLAGKAGVNPALFFDVSREILDTFFRVMRRLNASLEDELREYVVAYGDVDECRSTEQLIEYFERLLSRSLASFERLQGHRERKVIEAIKAFVFENYKKDITLSDLAHVVLLNPKYIGELFKKETGSNFSDFLASHRIEMAKELLKDGKLRINEVSDMVGYTDVKYFSALFRKHLGVSPAEYKKMFS